MAQISLRQDLTNLSSQSQLLEVMTSKIMNRNDFKPDFTKEMRLIAKSMIKKVNQLKPNRDILNMVSKFYYYQIGNKIYYEILAVEFAKNIDLFNFKNKCKILYYFALADIDSSHTLKTAHKLCSSYSEALLHREKNGGSIRSEIP